MFSSRAYVQELMEILPRRVWRTELLHSKMKQLVDVLDVFTVIRPKDDYPNILKQKKIRPQILWLMKGI
jgi:hypothetical protein